MAISSDLTGNPIPQLGFGSTLSEGPNAGKTLLVLIDELHRELGFPEYTGAFVGGKKSMIDVFAITLALMVGTAGLPHVIIRFYTVKNVRAARWSALWALLFIGTLYTSAPAVAAFARANLIQDISQTSYEASPEWFKNWENSGLLAWTVAGRLDPVLAALEPDLLEEPVARPIVALVDRDPGRAQRGGGSTRQGKSSA